MRKIRNRLIATLVLLTAGCAMLGNSVFFLNGGLGLPLNPFEVDWSAPQTYGKLLVAISFLVVAATVRLANVCPTCAKKMTSFREEPMCECSSETSAR
jgi:hypothetical protein